MLICTYNVEILVPNPNQKEMNDDEKQYLGIFKPRPTILCVYMVLVYCVATSYVKVFFFEKTKYLGEEVEDQAR